MSTVEEIVNAAQAEKAQANELEAVLADTANDQSEPEAVPTDTSKGESEPESEPGSQADPSAVDQQLRSRISELEVEKAKLLVENRDLRRALRRA